MRKKDNTKAQRTPSSRRSALAFVASLILGMLFFGLPGFGSTSFSYPARHDHAIGSCRGTLVFSEDGVRYEDAPHAAQWPFAEIQELRLLDTGRVRVLTYEDRGKLRLGADRSFDFEVLEGSLKDVVPLLSGKLDQRLVLGFAGQAAKVLAEFKVKHLRSLGGDEGTLVFAEDSVVYRSDDKGESRTWRYSDIESINLSDPLHLSVTTYEQQKFHYATRRVFNFQLKQPLPEATYNALWRRLNRSKDLEVFEKFRGELEKKAEAAGELRAGLEQAVEAAASQAPPQQAKESAGNVPAQAATPAGRGNPYLPMMHQILAEEGLPAHLVNVARVESGFNRFALSPKNARGLWQFIPETARRFGLRVDERADERTDPEKSTRAAARYLKELYGRFGDWDLALAGYNAGEKRVESALARAGLARAGTSEFTRLAGLLPRETQNYVPAVLAGPGGTWHSAAGRGYRLFAPAALSN